MDTTKINSNKFALLVYFDIICEIFETTVMELFVRIGQNEQQAQTLATLRDTLLPRLISGALHLPEADVPIEEAAA